jgi:hypothetical protein
VARFAERAARDDCDAIAAPSGAGKVRGVNLTSAEYAALLARRNELGSPTPRPKSEREADIQEQIETLLKSYGRECYYFRARMDKPTTGRIGTPDFIGWLRGRPFMLEVKRPGGKQTREQAGELMRGQLAGAVVSVVHSAEEAASFLEKLL